MQKIRWAILLLGVMVLLAAMIQNSENAPLQLFFYKTQLPISVLLLVTSAVSFLIGAITTGRMLKRSGKAKPAVRNEPPQPAEGPKSSPTAAKTSPFS